MFETRRRRERRAARIQSIIALAVFALIVLVLVHLAPASDERPLVTVYMKPDCESCRRWMHHLNARGFRTQAGTEAEWMTARTNAKLPPGFEATHHAVVEGLFIEGYVPARDIHRALKSPRRDSIRGLVLPGAPPGAPGIDAALKQPFVVFAVDENGLLRSWATHNHFVH